MFSPICVVFISQVPQCQLEVMGLAMISSGVMKEIWKQFLSVPRNAQNLIKTFFVVYLK